jgi:amino acid transporter
MAARAALPDLLARVHPRRRTPVPAVLLVAVAATAFTVVGDLAFIAAVTDFAVYVVFLAVNSTVLVLRRRRPELARPFAVPGSLGGVPVVPVLGIASVALMLTYLDPRAAAVGTGLSVLGLAAGGLLRDTAGDARPHVWRRDPAGRRQWPSESARLRHSRSGPDLAYRQTAEARRCIGLSSG